MENNEAPEDDYSARTDPLRVLVAASGSGGHIFPALSIVAAIAALEPTATFLFVGSGRPLEERLIDARGFDRFTVPMSPVKNKGWKGILKLLWTAPVSLVRCSQAIATFKPHLVLGVGGYVSVPAVIAGWWHGVPVWIHEAELKAGWANKVNLLFAQKVSLAYKDAEFPDQPKFVRAGYPLRPEIEQVGRKQRIIPLPKNILITGGSQGGAGLDSLVCQALCELIQSKELPATAIEIVHQCRESNLEPLTVRYEAAGVRGHVVSFIDQMDQAYAWADVVIARAGTGSVMEVGAVNLPAILVPLPVAAIGQVDNARYLEKTGKCIVVSEGATPEEKAAAVVAMKQAIKRLLTPSEYTAMRAKPGLQENLDAAKVIAKQIVSIAKKSWEA